MSDTGTAAPLTDEHRTLRRSLGFRDLVVYGLLFIAPMARSACSAPWNGGEGGR
ncbi:hypothetical protein [Streptomyces sp. MN13]